MEVLELIVAKRLRRGLLTVIDSTALDPPCAPATGAWPTAAGVPCHVVVVDTPERETPGPQPGAARGRAVGRRHQPAAVARRAPLDALGDEGFDGVHRASDGDVVDRAPLALRRAGRRPAPGGGSR